MKFSIVILSTFVLSAIAGKNSLHKQVKHGQKTLRARKQQELSDETSIWSDYYPERVESAVETGYGSFADYGAQDRASPVTVADTFFSQ